MQKRKHRIIATTKQRQLRHRKSKYSTSFTYLPTSSVNLGLISNSSAETSKYERRRRLRYSYHCRYFRQSDLRLRFGQHSGRGYRSHQSFRGLDDSLELPSARYSLPHNEDTHNIFLSSEKFRQHCQSAQPKPYKINSKQLANILEGLSTPQTYQTDSKMLEVENILNINSEDGEENTSTPETLSSSENSHQPTSGLSDGIISSTDVSNSKLSLQQKPQMNSKNLLEILHLPAEEGSVESSNENETENSYSIHFSNISKLLTYEESCSRVNVDDSFLASEFSDEYETELKELSDGISQLSIVSLNENENSVSSENSSHHYLISVWNDETTQNTNSMCNAELENNSSEPDSFCLSINSLRIPSTNVNLVSQTSRCNTSVDEITSTVGAAESNTFRISFAEDSQNVVSISEARSEDQIELISLEPSGVFENTLSDFENFEIVQSTHIPGDHVSQAQAAADGNEIQFDIHLLTLGQTQQEHYQNVSDVDIDLTQADANAFVAPTLLPVTGFPLDTDIDVHGTDINTNIRVTDIDLLQARAQRRSPQCE